MRDHLMWWHSLLIFILTLIQQVMSLGRIHQPHPFFLFRPSHGIEANLNDVCVAIWPYRFRLLYMKWCFLCVNVCPCPMSSNVHFLLSCNINIYHPGPDWGTEMLDIVIKYHRDKNCHHLYTSPNVKCMFNLANQSYINHEIL